MRGRTAYMGRAATSVRTANGTGTGSVDDVQQVARPAGKVRATSIQGQPTRGPAARTASLTPSAYAPKLSANIRAMRAAALS